MINRIKFVSLRLFPALWTRLSVASIKLGISKQEFCVRAIEFYLGHLKQNGNGEGGSARKAIEKLRKPNTQE